MEKITYKLINCSEPENSTIYAEDVKEISPLLYANGDPIISVLWYDAEFGVDVELICDKIIVV